MFRNAALTLLLIVSFCVVTHAQQNADLIITGGHYFDVETGTMVPNTGIAVAGERFLGVGIAPKDFKAEKTIKLEDDQFVLPGLIDCHAHYNVRLVKKRREEYRVMPVIYLANGVTTTFSCGEFDPEQMLKLRKDIESGEKLGPNLINSGPYFGRARPGWRGIRSEEDIKADVDFWAERGAGGFKAKAISPSELEALCKHAKRHGLTVTGHLDSGFRNSVNPSDAIDLGINRIEHFLGGDAMPDTKSAYSSLPNITRDMEAYKKIVTKFIETDTVFDATLTAYGYVGKPGEEYEPWINEGEFFTPFIQEQLKQRGPGRPMMQFQSIYEAKLKTIAAFFEAGGTITMGTDHVSDGTYLPGFGAHRELDAFSRAGVPNADVLKIGTINGAKALRIDENFGSLTQGKFADLLVVTGNPVENIRNTRNVQHVMRAGKLHNPKDLFESVQGKLGPSTEEETKDW
jgi:imidazolonepropionase-like amidohydrolase